MARWEDETVPLIELGRLLDRARPPSRHLTVHVDRAVLPPRRPDGGLLGFVPGYVLPASTQGSADSELLRISATVARQLAARDGRVAMVFVADLSERVQSFVAEIPAKPLRPSGSGSRDTCSNLHPKACRNAVSSPS
jgi:hypothetical protein